MENIRRSKERGHANHGWLDTYHTFSFADYHNPEFMGFRSLRVINEDWVAPSKGFGMHPHRNMEILTYVVSGSLEHRDSLNNGAVIKPSEIQLISAGSGIYHSEFNPSSDQPVHLLQIWITPEKTGLPPGYQQKIFDIDRNRNGLTLLAAPQRENGRGKDEQGEDGALVIHQDVKVYASRPEANRQLSYKIAPSRHVWLQVIKGELKANESLLTAGDGLAVSDISQLEIGTLEHSEFLLFDLA